MSLARFIVLKSNANNKYLCRGKEKGATHSSLGFSHEMKRPKAAELLELGKTNGESLKSEKSTEFHLLKFEVEEAKTAKGYVHIRTCYNRKYWVRKSADNGSIVAEAHEPEEDQSKWSCTLFKPVFLGDVDPDDEAGFVVPPNAKRPQKIQLIHVSSESAGQHSLVGASAANSAALEVRTTAEPEKESSDSAAAAAAVTFTAFDVEPTAILPMDFTLMDQDGKYVAAYSGNNIGFTTTDVGAPGVALKTIPELFQVRVPICHRDVNKSWILNQSSDLGLGDAHFATTFNAVKVDTRVVLYCIANGKFVSRTTEDGVTCRFPTITEDSKLRVGEPVTFREILSVDYNLDDARIYDVSSVDKFKSPEANDTSLPQTQAVEVEYTTSRTMTWSQSDEVHVGIDFKWSFGIPEVAEAGLDISFDLTETVAWGEEKTEDKHVKFTHTVTTPPRKKTTVTVVATKAFCDVPYTCQVRDLMTDGTQKEYTKKGMFTGCNEFDFNTAEHEEDL